MEFCTVVELSNDAVGTDLESSFPLVPGEGEMLWSCGEKMGRHSYQIHRNQRSNRTEYLKSSSVSDDVSRVQQDKTKGCMSQVSVSYPLRFKLLSLKCVSFVQCISQTGAPLYWRQGCNHLLHTGESSPIKATSKKNTICLPRKDISYGAKVGSG